MVDGRFVVRDGRLALVNEAELRERVERVMDGLRRDMAKVGARVEEVMPYLMQAYRRVWDTDVGINRYVGHGKL
jgi:hypothetical protein